MRRNQWLCYLLLISFLVGCAVTPAILPTPTLAPIQAEDTPAPHPEGATQPNITPTPLATARPIPPRIDQPLRDELINLAHLQRLTELVEWEGDPVAFVYIYAEAPDYLWVDASGEGISTVSP